PRPRALAGLAPISRRIIRDPPAGIPACENPADGSAIPRRTLPAPASSTPLLGRLPALRTRPPAPTSRRPRSHREGPPCGSRGWRRRPPLRAPPAASTLAPEDPPAP